MSFHWCSLLRTNMDEELTLANRHIRPFVNQKYTKKKISPLLNQNTQLPLDAIYKSHPFLTPPNLSLSVPH